MMGFSKETQLDKKVKTPKPLKKVSKKQAKELGKRSLLKAQLIIESKGFCMKCHKKPDYRGFQLVHKISLARGGKTERGNCEVWCGKCHSKDHHLIEAGLRTLQVSLGY